MIGIRITGGLGNQLFQYAAARALSLRHKTGIAFETSSFQRHRRGETPRGFELHNFNVSGNPISDMALHLAARLRRTPDVATLLTRWQVRREHGLHFNRDFLQFPEKTLLIGYWQSFKYFDSHASTIYQDLKPAKPLSSKSEKIAEHMASTPSISLHIRRGDYVSLKAAASLHGALSIAYYSRAIDKVLSCVEQPHFFVFSDDPAWCMENLPLGKHRATYVSHNAGDQAWQDLALMGRCRHSVIANSSFSWWGAWLGDQASDASTRIVIAPERWFSGQDHDTSDRYPVHWLRMGVDD